MTIVFVHGVPECAAVWQPLIAALNRDDIVTLSPPGFGAPVPDGFEATSDAYRDWLVAELESIGEPVDLVGHDWGGGHVMRAATARPELVRTLITDIAGTADPEYVWHDMAQVWQTPGDGEAVIEGTNAIPVTDRAASLVDAGMTPDVAAACAEASDTAMGASILALYRSAVQPNMTEWGIEYEELTNRPRTLVIVATEDHYTGGEAMARRTALRWGADVARLEGLGHWWMNQDPAAGAAALTEFWGATAS